MDISIAMVEYNSEIEWSCNANDYDQLIIHSDHDKPSLEELEKVWDEMTDEDGNVISPPTPAEAYDEIEALLIEAYGEAGAEKPHIEAMKLIDKYPSVERQLEKQNYEVVMEYVEDEILPNEEIVTEQMTADIRLKLLGGE